MKTLLSVLWMTSVLTTSSAQLQSNDSAASLLVNGRSLDGYDCTLPLEWIPGSSLPIELSGDPLQPVALYLGDQLEPGSYGPFGVVNLGNPAALFNGFAPSGFPFLTSPLGLLELDLSTPLPLGTEFSLQGVVGNPHAGARFTAPERVLVAPARLAYLDGQGLKGTNVFNSTGLRVTAPSQTLVREALFSPPGLRLAFVGFRDLFLADPIAHPLNGRPRVTASTGLLPPEQLAWSPDGSQLAFVYPGNSGSVPVLHLIGADGTGLLSVTSSEGLDFAWSPDGSRIAFRTIVTTQGPYEVFAVDPDGTNLTNLLLPLVGQTTVSSPPSYSWSPNSQELLVGFANPRGLYVVSADAGSSALISTDPAGTQWSHDGTRVAYQENDGGSRHLYTCLPDGSETVRVNDSAPSGSAFVGVFSWSPVALQLAYSSNEISAAEQELFVSDPFGGQRTKVSGFPSVGDSFRSLRWSPEGSRIAYLIERGSTGRYLFITTTSGSTPKLLSTTLEDPLLLSKPNYAWSPDPSRLQLAYTADDDPSSPGLGLYVYEPEAIRRRRAGDLRLLGDAFDWDPSGRWVGINPLTPNSVHAFDTLRNQLINLSDRRSNSLVWSPNQPPGLAAKPKEAVAIRPVRKP